MKIILNGEPYECSDAILATLVAAQNIRPPFAVAVNTRFVPKTQYEQVVLQEGDEVEIVRPVVGG